MKKHIKLLLTRCLYAACYALPAFICYVVVFHILAQQSNAPSSTLENYVLISFDLKYVSISFALVGFLLSYKLIDFASRNEGMIKPALWGFLMAFIAYALTNITRTVVFFSIYSLSANLPVTVKGILSIIVVIGLQTVAGFVMSAAGLITLMIGILVSLAIFQLAKSYKFPK